MNPRTINILLFSSLILLLTSCYIIPVSYAPSNTPIDPNNIVILGHTKGKSVSLLNTSIQTLIFIFET